MKDLLCTAKIECSLTLFLGYRCYPGECHDTEFCTPCSRGQYNNQTNKTSCQPCSKGTFGNTTKLTACDECQLGEPDTICRIHSSYDHRHVLQLLPVPIIGTFSNETGSQKCTDCTPGSFAHTTGKESCEPCPAGQYCRYA